MPRYYLELSYKGDRYAGFQVQENANTVQAEVEKALGIYFRSSFSLTGSSRTDAGVHARQNFFHFDKEGLAADWKKAVYHLNAILPEDIAIREIREVAADAHCRFDALSRSYEYKLYRFKDPFLADRAYYFPYKIDMSLLQEAAAIVLENRYFEAFAKRNSQVHTYECSIYSSEWKDVNGNLFVYAVTGNRFLRGMVRGLVGTMLRVGTGKLQITDFRDIIVSGDASRADFSVPGHGLSLLQVSY